jgi:two-component sensor histidine kinase
MMFRSSQSWNAGSDGDDIVGSLKLALAETHCGVTVQDRDLNYLHIINMPSVWLLNVVERPSEIGLYGSMLGEKLTLAKLAVVATGETQKINTLVNGKVATFSMNAMNSDDGSLRIVTTIQDVTQSRRRESTLRTLLLELSHRSKNLLAIVQGLASQSAKYAKSKDDFLKEFNGRLHALSGAQDVIVDANWQGASLHELARRQLALATSDRDVMVAFDGEDLELDANQSLYIGLALHELAMLAVTATGEGPRSIVLKSDVDASGKTAARVAWQAKQQIESDQVDGSFGKVLLEKAVPSALSGAAVLNVSDDGLEWSVSFPLAEKRPPAKRKRRRSGD